ncbi:hypothetical protein HMPREF3034_01748, partial [Prevotella sp. DNF00663]
MSLIAQMRIGEKMRDAMRQSRRVIIIKLSKYTRVREKKAFKKLVIS